MVEIIIAVIGILSGGGLLQLLRLWVTSTKSYRRELKDDIREALRRIEDLEAENDDWKKKYFDLFYAYKNYKLRVIKIATEHKIDAEIIHELNDDRELDQMYDDLKKA